MQSDVSARDKEKIGDEGSMRLPEAILDALYAGSNLDRRTKVNHARGILFSGTFLPTARAAEITSAAVFATQTSEVLVRFSNSTGIPDIPDADPKASPRGIAVRLAGSDGSIIDLVGHSVEGFPASTPEAFLDFLAAISRAEHQPRALRSYLEKHPAARTFVESATPPTASYLSESYYLLHPYRLTSGHNTGLNGRLIFVPVGRPSDVERASGRGPDYLHEEIHDRVRHGEARMLLTLQVAEHNDDLNDISAAWPSTRERIVLGEISLHKEEKGHPVPTSLMFDPGRVTGGFELVGDPMISVRSAVYRLALNRRSAAN